MSKITIKKSLFTLVVLLMLALVVFSACDGATAFTPVTMPSTGEVTSNGGIAVQYGDYIYYVNGYQGSSSAENTYTNTIRTGAIVRVKLADLETIINAYDKELSTTENTEAIANLVSKKVELVVPNFYYSANTTNTSLAGLYIFNNRIYITTPNQELTAGGNTQYDQLVLTSYALDGSDVKQHYTFSSSSLSIMLSSVGNDVYATYVTDSDLHSINVATGEDTTIVEEISSVNYDATNNTIFYLDEDGNICKFVAGATEGTTLVVAQDDITYTISSISNGYVYYTQANSLDSSLDGKTTYYAPYTCALGENVVLHATPSSTYLGYGAKMVTTETEEITGSNGVNKYHIYTTYVDADGKTQKDYIIKNGQYSFTLNKIVGDTLYYTANSVSYTLDLATANATPLAYAHSLSTTAQSWAMPEVIGEYTFTLTSSGTVNVVKYLGDKNSTTFDLTLVEPEEDAE